MLFLLFTAGVGFDSYHFKKGIDFKLKTRFIIKIKPKEI